MTLKVGDRVRLSRQQTVFVGTSILGTITKINKKNVTKKLTTVRWDSGKFTTHAFPDSELVIIQDPNNLLKQIL